MERVTTADSNLINIKEAARQLGISYPTIWRWIKKGKVVPVRFLGLPYLTLDLVESLKKEKNDKATKG